MRGGEQSARTRTEVPLSEPTSEARRLPELPGGSNANPIGSAIFRQLRDLRTEFGRGGLPPRDERTPEDDARIAAFFVLQETNHILDQFRRAVEQGEQCRLVVCEHGRQLGKVIIEIRIEGVGG